MSQSRERPIEEILETLKDARYFIQANGWIRGSYGSVDTGFCSGGAVNQAVIKRQLNWINRHTLQLDVETELQNSMKDRQPIPVYNDSKHRRKKHIFRLFDRTIARLQKEISNEHQHS